jgi:hypothetical protein
MFTFLNGYKTILVSIGFLAYAALGYFLLHTLDIVQALAIVQIALSALGIHNAITNATTTTVSTVIAPTTATVTTVTPAIAPTAPVINNATINQ